MRDKIIATIVTVSLFAFVIGSLGYHIEKQRASTQMAVAGASKGCTARQ